MIRFYSIAFILISLFFSHPASAFFQGQFNYSGYNGSCLSCHGDKQYDGISFQGEDLIKDECWATNTVPTSVDDLQKRAFYRIQKNQSFHITLSLKNPGSPNAQGQALCPDTDCCENSPEPLTSSICSQAEFKIDGRSYQNSANEKTCVEQINICKDFSSAGINLLSEKNGTFTIGENDSSLKYFSETDHSQISHHLARSFSQGDLSWEFDYTPPQDQTFDRIWIGANVANNNSRADDLDLNSNEVVDFMIGDVLPNYCALCEDGNEPNENGQCSGCACSSNHQANTEFPIVLLSIFILFFLRRRLNKRS